MDRGLLLLSVKVHDNQCMCIIKSCTLCSLTKAFDYRPCITGYNSAKCSG